MWTNRRSTGLPGFGPGTSLTADFVRKTRGRRSVPGPRAADHTMLLDAQARHPAHKRGRQDATTALGANARRREPRVLAAVDGDHRTRLERDDPYSASRPRLTVSTHVGDAVPMHRGP